MVNKRFEIIRNWVKPGSKVLDLGCGDGTLLEMLVKERGVYGHGIDREEEMIITSIGRGISVFRGDIDDVLKDYSDDTYDYVILSQTLQQVNDPKYVLQEMLRVGKKAILSVPNFGYLVNRMQLMFMGKMPENKTLPYKWYNTPNIHFCTRRDFLNFSKELGISILKEAAINKKERAVRFMPDIFSVEGLYLLEGKGNSH